MEHRHLHAHTCTYIQRNTARARAGAVLTATRQTHSVFGKSSKYRSSTNIRFISPKKVIFKHTRLPTQEVPSTTSIARLSFIHYGLLRVHYACMHQRIITPSEIIGKRT